MFQIKPMGAISYILDILAKSKSPVIKVSNRSYLQVEILENDFVSANKYHATPDF